MPTYKYKNTSEQELSLIGLGVLKPGGTVRSGHPIENPNLTFLEEESDAEIGPETPKAPQADGEGTVYEDQSNQPNQTQE